MYNDAVISRLLGLFQSLSCVIKLHRDSIMACVIYECHPNVRDSFPRDRFSITACIGLQDPFPDIGSCATKCSFINEATGPQGRRISLGKEVPSAVNGTQDKLFI